MKPLLLRALLLAAALMPLTSCAPLAPGSGPPAPGRATLPWERAASGAAPSCVREGDSCGAPGQGSCCAGLICVGSRASFCASGA